MRHEEGENYLICDCKTGGEWIEMQIVMDYGTLRQPDESLQFDKRFLFPLSFGQNSCKKKKLWSGSNGKRRGKILWTALMHFSPTTPDFHLSLDALFYFSSLLNASF